MFGIGLPELIVIMVVTSHEDDPPRFSRDDPGPETVLAIARVE